MSKAGSQVGTGQRVVGEFEGDGDLLLEGRLEGSIHIGGHLTVGQEALIFADIVAASAHIDGQVEGRVRVSGGVTIGARGCLVGEVHGVLHVAEGGVFQRRIASDDVSTDTAGKLQATGDHPAPPSPLESKQSPPVRFFDARDAPLALGESDSGTIRRLTEDDTLPPAPTLAATASGPAHDLPPAKLPKEVPITRKQPVRTDTVAKRVPKAIVRASRTAATEDLDDPWFDTGDESADST
jgi:cytoskeletal protein CcmA (bactofilin family)